MPWYWYKSRNNMSTYVADPHRDTYPQSGIHRKKGSRQTGIDACIMLIDACMLLEMCAILTSHLRFVSTRLQRAPRASYMMTCSLNSARPPVVLGSTCLSPVSHMPPPIASVGRIHGCTFLVLIDDTGHIALIISHLLSSIVDNCQRAQ